jgi:hypothetical protein
VGFDELDKLAEEGALGAHLEAKRLPQTDVGVQLTM